MGARVRHRVDRLHQGPRRARGRGAGRLDAELIDEAWRLKQRSGGAMRQAGHRRRRRAVRARPPRRAPGRGSRPRAAAGRGPGRAPGRAPSTRPRSRPTSSCSTCPTPPASRASWRGGRARWARSDRRRVRAVTHLDVDDEDIERALEAAQRVLAGGAGRSGARAGAAGRPPRFVRAFRENSRFPRTSPLTGRRRFGPRPGPARRAADHPLPARHHATARQ